MERLKIKLLSKIGPLWLGNKTSLHEALTPFLNLCCLSQLFFCQSKQILKIKCHQYFTNSCDSGLFADICAHCDNIYCGLLQQTLLKQLFFRKATEQQPVCPFTAQPNKLTLFQTEASQQYLQLKSYFSLLLTEEFGDVQPVTYSSSLNSSRQLSHPFLLLLQKFKCKKSSVTVGAIFWTQGWSMLKTLTSTLDFLWLLHNKMHGLLALVVTDHFSWKRER